MVRIPPTWQINAPVRVDLTLAARRRPKPAIFEIQKMKQTNIKKFIVSGSTVGTSNKAEASSFGKTTSLWGQFYSSWPNPENQVYGVYSDNESDATGEVTFTTGTRVDTENDSSVSIKSGTYLAFPANGPMPKAVIDGWKAVWEHFSHGQSYVRAYDTTSRNTAGRSPQEFTLASKQAANVVLNLAPFGRWTLRDKAAQLRLALS